MLAHRPDRRLRPQPPAFIAIGSDSDVRHVLEVWQHLLLNRFLAEMPENDSMYFELTDALMSRMSRPAVRVVDYKGMDVVEIDRFRLRELQNGLLWLEEVLVEDHAGDQWTVGDAFEEVCPRPPAITTLHDAELALEIIDVIVEISAENFIKFDRRPRDG